VGSTDKMLTCLYFGPSRTMSIATPGSPDTPRLCLLRGGAEVFRKAPYHRENMGPHVTRIAAATHAPDNGADIAKVQEWVAAREYLESKLLPSFWKG